MITLAKKSDCNKVVNIITESFDSNPSVNWVVKNDKKRKLRIRELAKYSFKTALIRKGVFLSADGNGLALCYKYNHKGNFIKDYWNQLVLVISAIGLSRVKTVLKRETYIKKQRPKNGEFLYFWFLGANNKAKGNGAAADLKNYIFDISKSENLAIYLETSVLKNTRVYKRYGFETYNTWEDKKTGSKIWFMKREPK